MPRVMPFVVPARRLVATLGALLLLVSGLVAPAAPAFAAVSLAAGVEAPDRVLLGEPATVTVTAENTGDADQYNLSFRHVLPAGVEYVAGSSSEHLGEPEVRTGPSGETVLLWVNVSDLPVGGVQRLTYRVLPGVAELPVASTFTSQATVHASTDERTVPRFDGEGTYAPLPVTTSATSGAATTTVTAIRVAKSEPSPEHELLRGVHAHPTVFTLDVTNNGHHPTEDVVVVDHLPAQLELLLCGDVDNTAGGAVEYPGAPRLDAGPDVTTSCPEPTSVTTVEDPADLPAGVYTRVEWHLGTLGAGEAREIRYAAGIPQRANTMTFAGGTPTGPLDQAANLDNNTGPSTRETGVEQELTNHVEVAGRYTGPMAGDPADRTVSDSGELTVTAEDLAIHKTVDRDDFVHEALATFTLTVRTGEYADASDVVITDVLPDGLCPVGVGVALCDGVPAGNPPSATVASVTEVDGVFTLTFEPVDLSASSELTITYQARMLTSYPGLSAPTVAGDEFTNTVSLTGLTTVLDHVEAPAPGGTLTVHDNSSAHLGSGTVRLDKRVQPDPGTVPYECSADPAAYVDDAGSPFGEGSRVCFLLEVQFPGGVDTKNPVLTDFLPENLRFEAGHVLPSSTVTADPDTSGLVLRLGDPQGADRFVTRGGLLHYVVSAFVDSPAAPGRVDITGNLAKLRWTNTGGQVSFLRDRVDVPVAPAPPVHVDKAATHDVVVAGDVVDVTVTLRNDGTAADGSDRTVVDPEVWDVLPPGIACADVSDVSDGGTCTDAGDAGHPTFTGRDDRSAIRWHLPVSIDPGDTYAVTYRVTYPASVAAGATYTNVAHVRSYESPTNLGGGDTVEHFPADNVDTTVPTEDVDVPRARDDHAVSVPPTAVTKTNVTGVADAEQGPDASRSYAAVGEAVTYTVTATLPADTTVYGGVIADEPPTHVQVDDVTYRFSDDGGATWSISLPAGWTTDGATVTLPAAHEVGADPHVVEMTITATVVAPGPAHGATLTNTARVTTTDRAGGPLPPVTDTSTVTVVHPSPSPTKEADETAPRATDTVTYTVTARNVHPASPDAMRPTLFDAVVVDCVPAGLTVDPVSLLTGTGAATIAPDPVTHGCAADATAIVWQVGDLAWRSSADLATDPWPTLTYAVSIEPGAGGGHAYTNTATQTGTSTDGGGRTYSATTTETITVPGGGLTKTVDTDRAPVGDTVTYTVTAEVPARVNLYDAAIVDVLPTGVPVSSVQLVSAAWAFTDTGASGAPADIQPTQETDAGTGTVRWVLGDVAAHPDWARAVTVTYTAELAADVASNTAGTTRTNAARLVWNDADGGDPASPTHGTPPSSAAVTVQEPDVRVSKAVDDATPAPGERFTYTVTVSNLPGASRSAAHDVTVVDDVPAGVVVDETSIDGGGVLSADGRTITWTVDEIAVGGSVTFTYDATLASPAPAADQTNTVTVTEYFSLPGGGGREYAGPSDDVVVAAALPELTITKALLDAAPAYRGEPVRWQLDVTNTGDATAYEVAVGDELPPGWTYDTGSARVSVAGTAAVALEPDVAGRDLTWTNVADLGVGQTITVVLSATPDDDAVVGGANAHRNVATTNGKDLPGGAVVTEADDDATTRIDSADLSVVKTADGAAVAGAPVAWSLTVANDGPDAAAGPITVTDVVPAAVGDVAAAGAGWTVTTAPGSDGTTVVTAVRADALASGATAPVLTVTGTLAADLAAGTTLTNTAEVGSPTHDADDSNDTDSTTSTVTVVSDVGVTKSLVGDLVPGATATYAVDVTNHGPSVAHGEITVVDTLPAGLAYDSFAGEGWELRSQDEQELTFAYTGAAPVAVGPLPQLRVVVTVDPGLTADVTNTVTVHEPTDPTTGPEAPDTDAVTTTPTPSADLAIAKRHLDDVRAGETVRYELTVTNAGPSDAAGPLTVTDVLPAGLTYVSASSTDGWTCGVVGQEVTCTLAGGLTVADGASTLVLTVDVDDDLTGAVENVATVQSPTPDPHLPDNTDGDDSGVTVEADLGVEKVLVTDPVVAGEDARYRLTVTNHGPSASPGGIVVTDTLPEGMTVGSATGAGWTCTTDGDRAVECERLAGLAVGASAPAITVVARVDPGVGTTTLTNVASVDGPAADPNPANDSSHAPTPVTEDAEIAVTKTTVGAGSVRAGEDATFEVVVRNVGSSDARDVVVEDLLPAGMTLVSMTGAGWDCAGGVCTTDRVGAGQTAATITVVARVAPGVPDGTTLVNRAEVSTVTPGDDPSDNASEDDVVVVAEAGLALTKTHTGEAVAGAPTTFAITVTNHGPSDAVGPLTVTDTLPPGMTFLSASAPWTCTAVGAVECVLPDGLASGATAPVLELQVQVAASVAEGPLTNVARVDSPTTDPDPSDDEDTETVDVEHHANVSVTKTHTGPVRVGDDLTFTLRVRNGGPSPARDVVVVDTLPRGLVATAAAGDGWVCDVTDAEVRCELEDPLPPRTDAPAVTVTTTVLPSAYPAVDNVAEVSTSTHDPVRDDDRTTTTVDVPAQVDLAIAKSLAGSLVVGERATYELVVTNHGPTAAPGPITVTDDLPDGLAYAGRSCDADGATVTCVLDGPLDVGESATVTVLVDVGPGAYPEVVNTAAVSSPSEDVDPGNDRASVTSPVAPAPVGGAAAGGAAGAGALARTGAVLWPAVAAALLVLTGVGLVRRSRRVR